MRDDRNGFVDLHGKDYELVWSRRQRMRQAHPDWGLVTTLQHYDERSCRTETVITDADGRVIANGLAEEIFASMSGHMKKSALMCCETSSIGRALANAGYATGTSNASADEVHRAEQRNRATVATVAPSPSAPRDVNAMGRAVAAFGALTLTPEVAELYADARNRGDVDGLRELYALVRDNKTDILAARYGQHKSRQAIAAVANGPAIPNEWQKEAGK